MDLWRGGKEQRERKDVLAQGGGVLRNVIRLFFYRVETRRGDNYAVCNGAASDCHWKKEVISVTVGFACPRCVVSTCRR